MDNPEKLATNGTQDEDKQVKHNTICVGHHYTQTNTNNVNKTCALLQTTGGKNVIILFIFPFLSFVLTSNTILYPKVYVHVLY